VPARLNSARDRARFNRERLSGAYRKHETTSRTPRRRPLSRDGEGQSQGDDPRHERYERAFSVRGETGEGEVRLSARKLLHHGQPFPFRDPAWTRREPIRDHAVDHERVCDGV
jgi:hypothetical protein